MTNLPNDPQLTEEEAIEFAKSEVWEEENWTHWEIARFGLFQELLCMPFGVLHEAVEKSLGRPVFTHEFGLNADGIRREFLGLEDTPSFEDVLNLIPEEKRIVILADEQ